MIHLTLNTGHAMEVPADKVTPLALRMLTPMVVKGGDLVPHFAPWRTVIGRGEGHASFDIRRNQTDIVTLNVVAWTPSGATAAWTILEKHYLDSGDALAKACIPMDLALPEMPATLPWLATWILPTAMMAVNPQDIGWMSDFEQCLAAAILKRIPWNHHPRIPMKTINLVTASAALAYLASLPPDQFISLPGSGEINTTEADAVSVITGQSANAWAVSSNRWDWTARELIDELLLGQRVLVSTKETEGRIMVVSADHSVEIEFDDDERGWYSFNEIELL